MQFQAGKEMAPLDRTDLPTDEEQQEAPAAQEAGVRRQGEEDDTLDWAAAVTTHAEDGAEVMDLSTENISELEGAGRQETTQENVTSRKTSAMDESIADNSGQGEDHSANRRQAGTEEQPRTENAKNRASRSKKIKLETGSARTTERKRSRNRTTQPQTKDKM
jgi:hypothetical protein